MKNKEEIITKISLKIKNYNFCFFKFFVIGVMFSFTLGSCVPHKQMMYVQGSIKSKLIDTFSLNLPEQTTIKPADQLFIKITSPDPKMSDFFNQIGSSQTSLNTEIDLITYTVSDSGNVDIPFVGNVLLKNKTLEEAKLTLQKSLKDYLNNPSIIIKFANRNITVIGEVLKPGRYQINKDVITLFDALGLAGDISYYGNRRNVTLIRTQNSTISYHYLDLTDKEIVKSEYFFLKPNDVLYVEPLKNKNWGIQSIPGGLSTILSAISTTILIITLLK